MSAGNEDDRERAKVALSHAIDACEQVDPRIVHGVPDVYGSYIPVIDSAGTRRIEMLGRIDVRLWRMMRQRLLTAMFAALRAVGMEIADTDVDLDTTGADAERVNRSADPPSSAHALAIVTSPIARTGPPSLLAAN